MSPRPPATKPATCARARWLPTPTESNPKGGTGAWLACTDPDADKDAFYSAILAPGVKAWLVRKVTQLMATASPTTKRPTATAAATPATGKTCVQLDAVAVDGKEGFNWVHRGAMIRAVEAATTNAACALECNMEPLCIYFTIHDADGCQLRRTKTTLVESSAFDAGHGECVTAASSTTTAAAPATGATCTMLKRVGLAYAGKIVVQYNNADGATAITDPLECAAKCKADLRCIYFSVNKAKSKGCALKSTRRGSAIKNAAYLGHGTCEHPAPATCTLGEVGKGDKSYLRDTLAQFPKIINAVRPAPCRAAMFRPRPSTPRPPRPPACRALVLAGTCGSKPPPTPNTPTAPC